MGEDEDRSRRHDRHQGAYAHCAAGAVVRELTEAYIDGTMEDKPVRAALIHDCVPTVSGQGQILVVARFPLKGHIITETVDEHAFSALCQQHVVSGRPVRMSSPLGPMRLSGAAGTGMILSANSRNAMPVSMS